MDREGVRPKARRKLNRSQITEILERNVQLYKEETNFVHYLVDLAVYLLEYEYDWEDTGGRPFGIKGPEPENDRAHITPAVNMTPPPQEAGSANAANSANAVNAQKSKVRGLTFESFTLNRRLCPYCGSIVGDLVICPTCRNVTR